jgi:hypothetical protein
VGSEDLTYAISVQGDSALLSGEWTPMPIRSADWLGVSPDAGTVTPGSQDTVEVLVDATGLDAGTYWATLRIDSDDPDESWLLVPVELTVTEGVCGDANGDEIVTPSDGYMILNYLGAGPQPVSCWAANVNGDSGITPGDGFHLLNYLGAGADLTCAPCEFVQTRRSEKRDTR